VTVNVNDNSTTIVTSVALLTIFIVKDNGSYMSKCPELDLVTEMDTKEDALKAMVEMITEYAEDYRTQEEIYLRSPNRSHHKPYVDAIIACHDEWEVLELLDVRYAHIYI
jgi:predicted RNase H-like HicB family nuclease